MYMVWSYEKSILCFLRFWQINGQIFVHFLWKIQTQLFHIFWLAVYVQSAGRHHCVSRRELQVHPGKRTVQYWWLKHDRGLSHPHVTPDQKPQKVCEIILNFICHVVPHIICTGLPSVPQHPTSNFYDPPQLKPNMKTQHYYWCLFWSLHEKCSCLWVCTKQECNSWR